MLPGLVPHIGLEFGNSNEGHFGLATVDSKALKSEKGIQIKDHLMARLHHANLFVQMRVIDCQTKEII